MQVDVSGANMLRDDVAYYRRRAAEERQRAKEEALDESERSIKWFCFSHSGAWGPAVCNAKDATLSPATGEGAISIPRSPSQS